MREIVLVALAVLVVGVSADVAQAQVRAGPAPAFVSWTAPGTAVGDAVDSGVVDPNALLLIQVHRSNPSWARRGALLGALAGGFATYLILHSGGSTSLCDRSANQDAMGKRECWGVTVAGGAAGAGLGAWIGGRFPRM